MSIPPGDDPPPEPSDLEGWRRAVDDESYRRFRMESIVAAIQDLGPRTDKAVLNPLAKHLSDKLLSILNGLVRKSYPNKGKDIIERTHAQLIEAILQPKSADGKGLRVAFFSRVSFRVKDALASEERARRTSQQPLDRMESSGAANQATDPTVSIHEALDVESVLAGIDDDRKRLAFRLHMDGIPFKSRKSHSISNALGISEKTAREWVREIQDLLSSNPEVQELLQSNARGT